MLIFIILSMQGQVGTRTSQSTSIKCTLWSISRASQRRRVCTPPPPQPHPYFLTPTDIDKINTKNLKSKKSRFLLNVRRFCWKNSQIDLPRLSLYNQVFKTEFSLKKLELSTSGLWSQYQWRVHWMKLKT